jgi:DNA-binding transcriptional MerR regulator
MDKHIQVCYAFHMAYTIKAACALLDVPADTLRKWERRYDLVSPHRGDNAYRGYSDLDLKRLALFKKARAKGVAGQEAAQQARALAHVAAGGGDAVLERQAESAIEGLSREKLVAVCARAEQTHGKTGALLQVWIPLLSRLGERAIRLKGLEIAKEHFAVAILRERVLKQDPVPGRPKVALASPEGELHEIGMLALAQELQDKKLPYIYLGPNLPVDSLCAALSRAKINRPIICVSRKISRPSLRTLVKKIQRKIPGATVYLGGAGSLTHSNFIAELGGVFLGANLELGVEKLLLSLEEAI